MYVGGVYILPVGRVAYNLPVEYLVQHHICNRSPHCMKGLYACKFKCIEAIYVLMTVCGLQSHHCIVVVYKNIKLLEDVGDDSTKKLRNKGSIYEATQGLTVVPPIDRIRTEISEVVYVMHSIM